MSVTTQSGSVPRKSANKRHKIASAIMTLFAIAFTLLPILTIGIWVSQFTADDRGTNTFSERTNNR